MYSNPLLVCRSAGYLIPDVVNKDIAAARNKFYTKSQVVFDVEVITSTTQLINNESLRTGQVATTNETSIDQVTFADEPSALNSMAATSFIGGGLNVNNDTFISPDLNNAEVAYLNTNVLKTADVVTAPNIAIFTGAALLQPPVGSLLPPTSNDNFTFYVNGVNVASSFVTIVEAGGNVTLVFDTTSMGYTLIPTDEVLATGKFQ